jgi:hypothetical protein
MNVIGIDPGKHGGIIIINDDYEIKKYTIPKIGNEIDVRNLNAILSCYNTDSIVVIEKVHALFGASAGSTFDFGYTCGLLEGIIVANNFKYFMVPPKDWQKEMFQGIDPIYKLGKQKRLETKKMAELAYKRLFCEVDLYITDNETKSKKVHDGLVDALLIAAYGKRKFV